MQKRRKGVGGKLCFLHPVVHPHLVGAGRAISSFVLLKGQVHYWAMQFHQQLLVKRAEIPDAVSLPHKTFDNRVRFPFWGTLRALPHYLPPPAPDKQFDMRQVKRFKMESTMQIQLSAGISGSCCSKF